MFVPVEESVLVAHFGRWVGTFEIDSKPDILCSLISYIRYDISDPSLPFSSSEWSAEQEEISAISSLTSSTSWRGSSKRTLLSMNIYLVLKFKSLYPFYFYWYPIKKHSILHGFKYFLLSSGIQAQAVDPKTLKLDTSSLCPKYASKGVFPFIEEWGTLH